ncbi:hypothetical protein [Maribacter aestuarii]|uniref:hypothetical protein n=1 Tax=Maribacter aestuarii TaxID=1130723 RepID=UPI00248B3DDF|nr:hypothetical protein [Maribacter aestuarii]
MKEKLNLSRRIFITAIFSIIIWGHVAWDYFHDGIPVHYILHDDSLPGIPNWWGALLFPFFTYFLLYRINVRIDKTNSKESLQKIGLRFLGGLLFAVAIAVSFVNGIEITDYIMAAVFILAFIFPLYKSEYFLGWVLGSAFTFGAVIPIGFGSILCLLFFLIYKLVGALRGLFKPKIS